MMYLVCANCMSRYITFLFILSCECIPVDSDANKNWFRAALGMREASRMTDTELRERLIQKIEQSLCEKTKVSLTRRKNFGNTFERPITTRVSNC